MSGVSCIFRARSISLPVIAFQARLGVLALLVYAAAAGVGRAQEASSPASTGAPHWVGSWAAAPCAPADAEPRYNELQLHSTTVRQIVHLTAGGVAVRVRLANTFGNTPLLVQSVRVAPALPGGEIDPEKAVALTAGGKGVITIAPGKSVLTDAASLSVEPGSDLAVSFFVPDKVTAPAVHYTALQTSYAASGDQTAAGKLNGADKITVRLILTGVDVATRTAPYSIVAIGSSTTDGAHSSANGNRRWTDDLFRRLQAADGAAAPAVQNAGISGGRVLHGGRGDWGPVFGDSALNRFNRDVLAQSGVKYVIAFEGGNDIRMPGEGGVPEDEAVTAQQLIAAFQLMAKATHGRGAKFIAATITPSQPSSRDKVPNPLWEKTRLAFNDWVRTTHDTDGTIDFDAAIRNPDHPEMILARFDSGDHLHPNDAGYQKMADSIDLTLFQ